MKTVPTTTAPAPSLIQAPPAEHTENLLRGSLLMMGSLVFFALHTLVIKELAVTHHVGPWQSLWFRFAVSAVVTIAIFAPRKQIAWLRVGHSKLLIARGVVGALGTAFFYLTIPKLGAGISTLLSNTYVVFSILLAAWWLRETLSLRRLMWIGVTFIGMGLLVLKNPVTSTENLTPYYILAVLGALTAGFVIVTIRSLHRTESTATIFWSQIAWGLLLLTPVLPLVWTPLTWPATGLLIACGVMAAFGQIFMTSAFRDLPVQTGAGYQMALPVLTAIGGVICFDERLVLLQWLAAGLIVVGTWNTVRRRRVVVAAE